MEPIDSDVADFVISGTKPYDFILRGFSTASTNSSGFISLAVPVDPSSAGFNFSEWSALSSLFSEVKVVRTTIQIVPFTGVSISATPYAALCVGFNTVSSAAPGSEGAVMTLSESLFYNFNDTSPRGLSMSHDFTDLNYSLTSSVTDSPYAGTPGGWQLYCENGPSTTLTFKIRVVNMYRMRGRS
jgi:hypothetical protein